MIVLDCSAALEIALKTPRGLGMRALFLSDEDGLVLQLPMV